MHRDQINQMVATVDKGYTAKSVWETSLIFAPGSTAKINKSTTGTLYPDGGSVTLPEGAVVSIIGVGGGDTGNDHHVLLDDGRQAIIPFHDLGESILKKEQAEEALLGAVAKVTLSKPLPQSAMEFLQDQYYDYGLSLPSKPASDSESSVSFLMKAGDDTTLNIGIDTLQKLAGASFKSSEKSSIDAWNKTQG